MLQTIVLTLHVIGAGLMLGVVFFAFLIVLEKNLDSVKLSVLKKIYIFGTVAAIWQLITGVILYFLDDGEFRDSKMFWLKIGLFLLDGIVAVGIVDRKIKTVESKSKGNVDFQKTYLWNLFSLLIVISIITIGVFLTEG